MFMMTLQEFSLFKKSTSGLGLFGRMSESLHNLATSYVAKGRTIEFEKMNDYILKLTDKIHTMEKIGNRVQKERLGNCRFHRFMCYFSPILLYFYNVLIYLCWYSLFAGLAANTAGSEHLGRERT